MLNDKRTHFVPTEP